MTVLNAGRRRLAHVPDPFPDEPLDGWLLRTALALNCTPAQLRRWIGVPTNLWLLQSVTEAHLRAIETSTDVPVGVLRSMTLERWIPLGVRFGPSPATAPSAQIVFKDVGRVCRGCLASRDGANRLSWLVMFGYGCVEHGNVLQADEPDTLWLSGRAPVCLPQVLLKAQARLDALLAAPSGLVESFGTERPNWEYAADLGSLVRMALASPILCDRRALYAQLNAHGGQGWEALDDTWSFKAAASPSVRMIQARRQPALMGIAVTLATNVLRAKTPADASANLWWCTPLAREEAVHHARGRRLSLPLFSVLDDLPQRSRPARHLIMRFGLVRDQRDGSRASPLDAAKVPACCWSSSVAASGPGPQREMSALATSAALLTIGASRGLRGALDRLEHSHLFTAVREDWHRTFDGPDGETQFQAVTALHSALLDADVPINYARRRRTFAAPQPLGRNTNKRLAESLNVPATDRLATLAGWRVWELVTGSDILLTDRHINLPGNHRLVYRAQRARWEIADPIVFREVAEQLLLDHRIDEPLLWAPVLEGTGWEMPPVDVHLLPGWSTTGRAMRSTAHLRNGDTGGFGLAEAAALAARGDSMTGRLMRRNLIRFRAVAEHGSIKAGARALGLTGGTLSVQIRDLERDLATPLLDRSASTAVPTAQGHRLIHLIDSEPRLVSVTTREPRGRDEP